MRPSSGPRNADNGEEILYCCGGGGAGRHAQPYPLPAASVHPCRIPDCLCLGEGRIGICDLCPARDEIKILHSCLWGCLPGKTVPLAGLLKHGIQDHSSSIRVLTGRAADPEWTATQRN